MDWYAFFWQKSNERTFTEKCDKAIIKQTNEMDISNTVFVQVSVAGYFIKYLLFVVIKYTLYN